MGVVEEMAQQMAGAVRADGAERTVEGGAPFGELLRVLVGQLIEL